MLTLIAAALAAAAPATPAQPAPADAHAQHGKMAMKDCKCCCEEMMKNKANDGQKMDGMQDHQDHGASR